jgi:hypothetical protein
MRSLLLILLLLTAGTNIRAECPYTFSCTAQGCAKVTETSCTIPEPQTPDKNGGGFTSSSSAATFVSPTTRNSTSPNYLPSSPSNSAPNKNAGSAYGCAENGSCYGDVSSVNGTPKTIHVDGYYRRDGTYVRGHYRSRGR